MIHQGEYDMDLSIETHDDIAVVILHTEELNAGNAKWFKSEITPVFDKYTRVILDMNEIRFVDSSGCGTILSCFRQLHSIDGDLKLAGVQKPVQTLFELVRLHRIIEIYSDKASAIQSFSR
jgi:anti-sigma B factor antagonist